MQSVFVSNNISFDENQLKSGNAEYDSSLINKLDLNWTGGKILIIESAKKNLYFEENFHSQEIREEEKMHWCISDGKLFITYTKPGVILTKNLVKDLSLCIPKKLSSIAFNVVNSSLEYKIITAKKIDSNDVNSNLDLSFLESKKLNISGVNSKVKINLHKDFGATVTVSGVSSGFLGDKEEKYGPGKLKVNISGVNIDYEVNFEDARKHKN